MAKATHCLRAPCDGDTVEVYGRGNWPAALHTRIDLVSREHMRVSWSITRSGAEIRVTPLGTNPCSILRGGAGLSASDVAAAGLRPAPGVERHWEVLVKGEPVEVSPCDLLSPLHGLSATEPFTVGADPLAPGKGKGRAAPEAGLSSREVKRAKTTELEFTQGTDTTAVMPGQASLSQELPSESAPLEEGPETAPGAQSETTPGAQSETTPAAQSAPPALPPCKVLEIQHRISWARFEVGQSKSLREIFAVCVGQDSRPYIGETTCPAYPCAHITARAVRYVNAGIATAPIQDGDQQRGEWAFLRYCLLSFYDTDLGPSEYIPKLLGTLEGAGKDPSALLQRLAVDEAESAFCCGQIRDLAQCDRTSISWREQVGGEEAAPGLWKKESGDHERHLDVPSGMMEQLKQVPASMRGALREMYICAKWLTVDVLVDVAHYRRGRPARDYNDSRSFPFNHSHHKDIYGHLRQVYISRMRAICGKISDSGFHCQAHTDSVTPEAQARRIRLPLYEYQLKNISWMKGLELKCDEPFTLNTLATYDASRSDLLFDIEKGMTYTAMERKALLYTRGGILADEMGLGKSICVVGVILANPGPSPSGLRAMMQHQREDDYLLPSRATLIFAPSHLCKQWEDEINRFVSPPLKVIRLTVVNELRKVTYGDLMDADVVIVSLKRFAGSRSPLTWNPPTHRPVVQPRSYRAEGEAIFAETSPDLDAFAWHRIVVDEAHESITQSGSMNFHGKEKCPKGSAVSTWLKLLRSRYRWYVSGTPFPQGVASLSAACQFLHMHLHQFPLTPTTSVQHGSDNPAICFPQRGPYGGLHGHPAEVVEPQEQWFNLEEPGMYECRRSVRLGCVANWTLMDVIWNNLMVRNTKASVGQDRRVPPLVEDVRLLEMSQVERGLYRACRSTLGMRQLCCHPLIEQMVQGVMGGGKERTLDEIRESMTDHWNSEVSRLMRRCDGLRKEKADAAASVRRAAEADNKRSRADAEISLRSATNRLVEGENDLAHARQARQYFEGLVPRIEQSLQSDCVVCLDVPQEPTVTTCGHFFCRQCIVDWVAQRKTCPACRTTQKLGDLTTVKSEEKKNVAEENRASSNLQEQYGSKVAALIKYIRTAVPSGVTIGGDAGVAASPAAPAAGASKGKAKGKKAGEASSSAGDATARFIVFAEWDSLLRKIGDGLEQDGIKTVYCRGNVHTRNKAIGQFKTDPGVRVIMLSLENAASGTNLTEATHVIFMHPVGSSVGHAAAIENQALGRAHRTGQTRQITVVRFIIKDTVEEELYARNNAALLRQAQGPGDVDPTISMTVNAHRDPGGDRVRIPVTKAAATTWMRSGSSLAEVIGATGEVDGDGEVKDDDGYATEEGGSE